MSTSSPSPLAGTNLAILAGTLSRPAELRTLPSGDELLSLEVTVRTDGAAAESVPVAWASPSRRAVGWEAGEAVLVTGRVRRRFFRAGGVTQSRTEVVADRVVPLRRSADVRRALAGAVDALSERL